MITLTDPQSRNLKLGNHDLISVAQPRVMVVTSIGGQLETEAIENFLWW